MKRTYRAILVLVITSGLLALLGPVLSRAQNLPAAPPEPQWENGDSSSGTDFGTLSILRWDEPAPDRPVHHYLVQIVRFEAGLADTTTRDGVTEPTLEVIAEFGYVFKARVAAVDSLGVQSGFSPWSGAYAAELVYR